MKGAAAVVGVLLLAVGYGCSAAQGAALSAQQGQQAAAVALVVQEQTAARCAPGAPADAPPVEGEGALLAARAAQAAGFKGPDLRLAVAVAGAESSWNPRAGNRLADGRTHQGLWQISSLHEGLIAREGGDRYDPAANARMAKVLHDEAAARGSDPWQPWEAYTRGMHERFLPQADEALARLGVEVQAAPAVERAVAAPSCTPAPGAAPGSVVVDPGSIAASGWVLPSGPVYTSAYGMRTNPVTGVYKLHGGMDLAGGCGAPIYAAAGGVVTQAGPTASYGTLIVVQHAGGVSTYYAHSKLADHQVRTGDTVEAGQLITRAGNEGNSKGCHLHFEVRVNNERTDPVPFLTARGVLVPPLT